MEQETKDEWCLNHWANEIAMQELGTPASYQIVIAGLQNTMRKN